ncbi:hypothetical protein ACFQ7J_03390 [Streptomyces sp. NPDC056501]|uniref:hypothetical protein n=1 Tax=Streptomyces sp. NPDC056501 TaxID=3345841 RepID=UPI003690D06F
MTGSEKDRLTRLCRQFGDIRAVASRRGQLPALEAMLAELRAGGGDIEQLTRDVDELLRRCGIASGLGELRTPGGGMLPRLGPGHPLEEAHVCPVGRCDRVELDGNGMCELFVIPLHLVRW